MTVQKSTYSYTACRATSPTWMGKCSQCGTWDALVAKKQETNRNTSNAAAAFASTVNQFGDEKEAIQIPDIQTPGGLKLTDPAVDLAVSLSIMGAYRGIALPSDICAIGEVGLGGEVRCVPQIEQRTAQARRRGYKKMLVPITQQETGGEGCIGVASIGELEGFIDNNAIHETSQQRLSDGEKVEFSQCC